MATDALNTAGPMDYILGEHKLFGDLALSKWTTIATWLNAGNDLTTLIGKGVLGTPVALTSNGTISATTAKATVTGLVSAGVVVPPSAKLAIEVAIPQITLSAAGAQVKFTVTDGTTEWGLGTSGTGITGNLETSFIGTCILPKGTPALVAGATPTYTVKSQVLNAGTATITTGVSSSVDYSPTLRVVAL